MFTRPLLVVLGVALTVGIWFWVRQVRRPRELKKGQGLLPIVIVAGLLCRLIFVFFTPAWFAPDEAAHFKYVEHLAEQHSLPVQKHSWGDPSQDYEFCQPPVYYLLLTPFYRLTNAVFAKSEPAIFILRLCSVGFWLLNVWLGLVLLKRAEITDVLVRNFVLALVCLLPTYTFISATINNDNLLAPLGTAVLCLMIGPHSLGRSVTLGLVLGLALLTKQSALVFCPAVVMLFTLNALNRRINWPSALLHIGVILGLASLMYGPWVLRNFQLYGGFAPEQVSMPPRTWPFALYGLGSALHNLLKSFWAVSGSHNQIGYPFPLAGYAFLLLCLTFHRSSACSVGPSRIKGDVEGQHLVAGGDGRHEAATLEFLNLKRNGPFWGACLLAIVVNVLLVLLVGYQVGMGQGRHLFPVLVPLGLLLAARWRAFPVKALEPWTTIAWLSYALSFLAFSLYLFPEGDGL